MPRKKKDESDEAFRERCKLLKREERERKKAKEKESSKNRAKYLRRKAKMNNNTPPTPETPIRAASSVTGIATGAVTGVFRTISNSIRGTPQAPPSTSRAEEGTPLHDMSNVQMDTFLVDFRHEQIASSKKNVERLYENASRYEANVKNNMAELKENKSRLDADVREQLAFQKQHSDGILAAVAKEREQRATGRKLDFDEGIPPVYSDTNIHSPVAVDERKMPAKATRTQHVRSPENNDDDDIFYDSIDLASDDEDRKMPAKVTSAKKATPKATPVGAAKKKKAPAKKPPTKATPGSAAKKKTAPAKKPPTKATPGSAAKKKKAPAKKPPVAKPPVAKPLSKKERQAQARARASNEVFRDSVLPNAKKQKASAEETSTTPAPKARPTRRSARKN